MFSLPWPLRDPSVLASSPILMSVRSSRPRTSPPLRLVGEGESAPLPPLHDFDALFHRFAPYVATIALRIMGRDDEVDDLVQEVFFEAHRGLAGLRSPDAVKGWLARICVRRATRRLKRRRLRALFRAEPLDDHEQLACPQASPEQAAQVASAYRALSRLSADERVVWVLRHVEGHSLDELMELCRCSKSTVQRRLRAAEQALEEGQAHG
jgi:RNA polymerase sigma-70 factor (ECF subfamily)